MPPFQNYKQHYLLSIPMSGNCEDNSEASPRSLRDFESRHEIYGVTTVEGD